MAEFTVNGITYDPLAESKRPGFETGDPAESDYILVQTDGPLGSEARGGLDGAGVTILEHVGGDTYLCRYRGRDLAAIRDLTFVVWADVYPKALKVAPAMRADEPREVDVVLHADVDPGAAELKGRVAAAAGVDEGSLQTGRRKYRLVTKQPYLDDVAEIDEVHHIEAVLEAGPTNNVAGPIIGGTVVVNGTPYMGDGETIAVADTGFDMGSRTNVHPAFTGRVVALYDLGRPNMTNDPVGHGTHVAGSALGDGNAPSMGGAIRGTAPRARLVLQSLLDSNGRWGGIPTDLHDLFQPPYDNDGARIHTNSWGVFDPGIAYTTRSHEIDDFAWTHQDMVILFSAGNGGTDGNGDGAVEDGSLGAEAAAKNAITVGASESDRGSATWRWDTYIDNERPFVEFHTNPIRDDRPCNDADGMAGFSSRGPTREGRIKPDVVAPGTCILSARSRAVTNVGTGWGTSSDNAYSFLGGTSMSTPLVAGCTGVLRETLVRNGWNAPPSAVIKALLINGAVPLTGQYSPSEAGPSPNPSSGWGRVDLAGSVIIPGPAGDAGLGTGELSKEGQEDSFTVHVPGSTFKITLVWTDPPGAALQNDLDLIVRAPNGEERHGNMGTASELYDRLNNVEQVHWEHVPSGNLEVIIRAHRITQFAQPYAYAWRLTS